MSAAEEAAGELREQLKTHIKDHLIPMIEQVAQTTEVSMSVFEHDFVVAQGAIRMALAGGLGVEESEVPAKVWLAAATLVTGLRLALTEQFQELANNESKVTPDLAALLVLDAFTVGALGGLEAAEMQGMLDGVGIEPE